VICRYPNQFITLFFTSSCVRSRDNLLLKALVMSKPTLTSHSCWLAFMCVLRLQNLWVNQSYFELCERNICQQTIMKDCPELIPFPGGSLLYGQAFYVYAKDSISCGANMLPRPKFVCFKHKPCNAYLINISGFMFADAECYNLKDLSIVIFPGRSSWLSQYVTPLLVFILKCHSSINDDSVIRNRSTLYPCQNSSKFISSYRVKDGIKDCFYDDDESTIKGGT
jgi:hypothetical protein